MAVPKFVTTQLLGIFATNSLTAPTAFYIYVDGISRGEMAQLIGWKLFDGTLVDGPLTDWMQGLGASNHAVDLNSATLEEDTDASSPHQGRLRLKLTVGASVA